MRRELPEPVAVQANADHSTALGLVMDLLAELGVVESFPDVAALHAHAHRLREEWGREPARVADERHAVVSGLAAGSVEIGDARARISVSDSGTSSRATLRRAYDQAIRDAWRALAEYGEAGLIAVLAPIAEDAVRESVTLAGGIDSRVTDYGMACLVGKRASEEWLRLGSLHDTWSKAHKVVDTLRAEDALPVVADRAWPRYLYVQEYRYRYPEWSLDVPGMPVERFLSRVTAAGAGPGMFTVADVAEHRAEDAHPAPGVA